MPGCRTVDPPLQGRLPGATTRARPGVHCPGRAPLRTYSCAELETDGCGVPPVQARERRATRAVRPADARRAAARAARCAGCADALHAAGRCGDRRPPKLSNKWCTISTVSARARQRPCACGAAGERTGERCRSDRRAAAAVAAHTGRLRRFPPVCVKVYTLIQHSVQLGEGLDGVCARTAAGSGAITVRRMPTLGRPFTRCRALLGLFLCKQVHLDMRYRVWGVPGARVLGRGRENDSRGCSRPL